MFKKVLGSCLYQKTVFVRFKYTRTMNQIPAEKQETVGEPPIVDLRSDTLTKPTVTMRQAMFEAEVGDDVFGEDPTVNALEKRIASLLDKEDAVFTPTGTMSNLIAIMCHCSSRGSEIIVGDLTHIFKYEQGGAAQIAGVQTCTLKNNCDGTFDLDDLENHIRGDDIHEPVTSLICVENTHNLCGGKALSLKWLDKLAHISKLHGVPLHMDGARLFNASVYQNVAPSRIVRDFDTVSVCLSKGLGAPVGSLLVGSKQFIKRARRTRKALGAGMRQVGVIAAAGLIALGDDLNDRLIKDHNKAWQIAQAIENAHSKWVTVDVQNLHTNIILLKLNASKICSQEFCHRLSTVTEHEKQILGNATAIIKAFPKDDSHVRLVTHANISEEDVDIAIKKILFIIKEFDL